MSVLADRVLRGVRTISSLDRHLVPVLHEGPCQNHLSQAASYNNKVAVWTKALLKLVFLPKD